jgi:hypothetical protein
MGKSAKSWRIPFEALSLAVLLDHCWSACGSRFLRLHLLPLPSTSSGKQYFTLSDRQCYLGLLLLVPHFSFHTGMGANWPGQYRSLGSYDAAFGSLDRERTDVAYRYQLGQSTLVVKSFAVCTLDAAYAQTTSVTDTWTNAKCFMGVIKFRPYFTLHGHPTEWSLIRSRQCLRIFNKGGTNTRT